MTLGMALLFWLVFAAITGALFTLAPHGNTERWLFGCGLLLAAVFLLVAVALPVRTPVTVAAPIANTSPASTTTAEAPPAATTAPTAPTAAMQTPTAGAAATALPTVTPDTGATTTRASRQSRVSPVTPTTTPDVVIVTTGIVNVRSAPAFGNNVIGQVIGGDELIVVDSTDGWLLVRLGTAVSPVSTITNGEGWVNSELITR